MEVAKAKRPENNLSFKQKLARGLLAFAITSGLIASSVFNVKDIDASVDVLFPTRTPTPTQTSTPIPYHQPCNVANNLSCPQGQYCFVQSVIGPPEGTCIKPGESVP